MSDPQNAGREGTSSQPEPWPDSQRLSPLPQEVLAWCEALEQGFRICVFIGFGLWATRRSEEPGKLTGDKEDRVGCVFGVGERKGPEL